jgi:hypothetical protein
MINPMTPITNVMIKPNAYRFKSNSIQLEQLEIDSKTTNINIILINFDFITDFFSKCFTTFLFMVCGVFMHLIAKNGQSESLKADFFEPLKKSFQIML